VGIPDADHDHGQFRSFMNRNCPWSWISMVRGCRL